MKTIILQTAVLLAALVHGVPLTQAGDYNIRWSGADGGGGSCRGGLTPAGGTKFTLSGTVGQPDAGGSTAGTYVHQGGFIPAFTLPVTPKLLTSMSGSTFTHIWPDSCKGFVLEASPVVAGGVWTSLGGGTLVNGNRQVIVFSPTSPVFWRLRKDCPASCASTCSQ